MSDVERFRLPLRGLIGQQPVYSVSRLKTAWVDVGDQVLAVQFGPWRLSTPLANITDAAVMGPYAFWKTAGPARLAITDRGLTFATNGKSGVLISFRPRFADSSHWEFSVTPS